MHDLEGFSSPVALIQRENTVIIWWRSIWTICTMLSSEEDGQDAPRTRTHHHLWDSLRKGTTREEKTENEHGMSYCRIEVLLFKHARIGKGRMRECSRKNFDN